MVVVVVLVMMVVVLVMIVVGGCEVVAMIFLSKRCCSFAMNSDACFCRYLPQLFE